MADATRLKRPQKEIAGLTDFDARIADLTNNIQNLGPSPDAGKAAPMNAELNSLATDMAHGEATALARAARLMERNWRSPPARRLPAEAAAAVTAEGAAKSKLDDAVAATLKAADPLQSLKAARLSLTVYDAFAASYGTASAATAQFYLSARRNAYTAADTAARASYAKVLALGKVTQPWLLASKARKQAYQDLTANVTQAAAQLAQLNTLYQATRDTKDLKQLQAALAQATAIKAALDDLLAKSTAATAIFNQ